MEQTKSKNWKDTLAEVRKVIFFHEFELILDKEKRSTYDEFYFFKRGLKRKAQSLLFFLSAMRSADNRTLVRPTSRKKKVAPRLFFETVAHL